ncbi:ABC transporter substrate-binding protein [Aquipuribacter sp. MA13-6]|uniref:ABC transporter substrate-binding protein n=1 Tax=unclassified Aquipuribacter TaxID=2635084 RepID=UPI003EEECCCC
MTARTTRARTTAVALGAAAALVLAACGGGTDSGTADSGPTDSPDATSVAPTDAAAGAEPGDDAAAFPVTVTSGQEPETTEVTIEAAPAAIVSISPTATEMLFAVGAGEQVVAVDAFSYYPEEAPVTDLSGFEPNLEAILGYGPDLVISSGDPGDLASGLEAAGVPTLVLPSALTLDEAYDQIQRVGLATGRSADAEALTEQMAADIEAAVASVPAGEPLSYYHELDPSFFSASGDTFIGEVYSLFGLENIADATGEAYPQLSQEFIVEADPDVIFVTSGDFSDSPETIAARPGWAEVDAVADGDVVVVDADESSRWGPRVVDFVESVAEALPTVQD